MKTHNKFTKYEKKQHREAKLAADMAGTGLFVYQNNTGGDLILAKTGSDGTKKLAKGATFQGDSYFKQWVGPPLNTLRFISIVTESDNNKIVTEAELAVFKGEPMPEPKLIIDQPDRVLEQPKENKETTESKESEEMLLTEEPMDGVEIILN